MKVYAQGDEGPANPEFTRSTKTVLVVEDEAFVRESTCEILQSAGYRVLQAGNAAEARKVFCDARAPIDLMLCDAVLPDENGMRLTIAARAISPAAGNRGVGLSAIGFARSVRVIGPTPGLKQALLSRASTRAS